MALGFRRLQDYSIQFYLRNQLSFSVENEVMTTTDLKKYKAKFKEWVPDRYVLVVRNDKLVDKSEYIANYREGEINFLDAQKPTDKIKISYSYTWIKILPGFPDEKFNPPLISVETGTTREGALQLGGGKWVYTLYHLNIWAANTAQRDDMADLIKDVLDNDAPFIDYNLGFPLLTDGKKNPNYDEKSQKLCNIVFDNVRVYPNPNRIGEEYEQNRALVEFIAVSVRR